MDKEFVAGLIYLVVIKVWRHLFAKRSMVFWQLAAECPTSFYSWVLGRNDWIVLEESDPKLTDMKSRNDLVGPFRADGRYGPIVLFAKSSTIEQSQEEFIAEFGGDKVKTGFPWISWILMYFPLLSIIYISAAFEVGFLGILGYCFAQLGYILLVSGIVVGHFRSLGFGLRKSTIVAAVVCWGFGTVLANI